MCVYLKKQITDQYCSVHKIYQLCIYYYELSHDELLHIKYGLPKSILLNS